MFNHTMASSDEATIWWTMWCMTKYILSKSLTCAGFPTEFIRLTIGQHLSEFWHPSMAIWRRLRQILGVQPDKPYSKTSVLGSDKIFANIKPTTIHTNYYTFVLILLSFDRFNPLFHAKERYCQGRRLCILFSSMRWLVPTGTLFQNLVLLQI